MSHISVQTSALTSKSFHPSHILDSQQSQQSSWLLTGMSLLQHRRWGTANLLASSAASMFTSASLARLTQTLQAGVTDINWLNTRKKVLHTLQWLYWTARYLKLGSRRDWIFTVALLWVICVAACHALCLSGSNLHKLLSFAEPVLFCLLLGHL